MNRRIRPNPERDTQSVQHLLINADLDIHQTCVITDEGTGPALIRQDSVYFTNP